MIGQPKTIRIARMARANRRAVSGISTSATRGRFLATNAAPIFAASCLPWSEKYSPEYPGAPTVAESKWTSMATRGLSSLARCADPTKSGSCEAP